MHLLKIEQSGELYAEGEAVDLNQPPARLVILTAADSEIALFAAAARRLGFDESELRLANILSLSHPYSVDIYIEQTLAHAKAILVRLLGGRAYWPYGCEQLAEIARRHQIPLAFIPGDGHPDPELDALSTIEPERLVQLAGYADHGGMDNAAGLLIALDDIITGNENAPPPKPLLKAGLYWPDASPVSVDDMRPLWKAKLAGDPPAPPIVAIVFYRALTQSGQTEPVDALIDALAAEGVAALPVYAASLKDDEAASILANLLEATSAEVILNATSFAISDPAAERRQDDASPGPFGIVDAPVIQIMLSTSTEAQWQASYAGLTPRDLAMNVVLPELDGRIISRAIGFKTLPAKDRITHAMVTRYAANRERAVWVARLAAKWVALRGKSRHEVKLALIMANYPNRDGRLANGVGLDTPASAVVLLKALAAAGYTLGELPADSASLMAAIKERPTNSGIAGRKVDAWLPLDDYRTMFADLPLQVQRQIAGRWGDISADPMLSPMPDGKPGFALPVLLCGHLAVAIQPARGYNIDPKSDYHSPDLPPPHHYLAFYLWCRHIHQADALIHLGKHGNLEWLPGKALALDADCLPEACLGALPHFYPFIVNDPGEGSQAKRRAAAVILDHLTPAMTLADSYGVMAELEASMDEYYEASGIDARRRTALMADILEKAEVAGLAKDCGIGVEDNHEEKLLKLDSFLCDIKEMQIRDGLHIYGEPLEQGRCDELLASILRIPRGDGMASRQSILRLLARDLLGEGFDPLTAERTAPWRGEKPPALARMSDKPWRNNADTVERLNRLASGLIAGRLCPDPAWKATRPVLEEELPAIRRAVTDSPAVELRYFLRGLEGRYVPAGASGAPTRGRPEVLPTGRNFFSVDTRAVPTPAAWRIGWASASALLDRYVQDNGDYPAALVLSVWGTANMRTGGDDLAQALALMGAEPVWDTASRRVTGFNIMPASVLGRPRVDVTLRASGFFRDAFPAQIALFDKVVKAVSALDEPAHVNPLAARVKAERARLVAGGMEDEQAGRMALYRVFSARPGAYGAGLQTLIDERIWDTRADFAEAFLAWGGYAYGEQAEGVADRSGLARRLEAVDAVIHNQDNHEHDILDSDDYYQFAGGLAATVAVLKGRDVPVYLGDHGLAEAPRIRSLAEEIARVVRGRATNPKWIEGVMRHGYKGAFEMAATLDYLFAFAVTTNQVESHHFEALFDHWMNDERVADFLQENNPDAWREMLDRFREAVDRGVWRPRRNDALEILARAGESRHDERHGDEAGTTTSGGQAR